MAQMSVSRSWGKYLAIAVLVVFVICSAVYVSTRNTVLVPEFMTAVSSVSLVGDVDQDLPLTDDDIYVDDSVARKLFDEVKIYCWILTTRSGILSKAAAVNFTWAPRCNKHVFFASAHGQETNPGGVPATTMPGAEAVSTFDLNAGEKKEYKAANGETFNVISVGDILFIDTPEGWQNLTEKSREILQLIYMTEIDNFDWFLKADDDTYVIMENLRFLLKSLDSSKPAYMGYHLEPSWNDSPYMSGGAGYVFSKAGLKALVEKGIRVKNVCLEKGSFEDLEIGRCAVKSGVAIYSSLDKFERETFHPDHIQDYIPGPPKEWLFYYSRYKPKGGSECCSQFSVTFHRMPLQQMLIFDHLLYKTHVYGRQVTGRITEFFKLNKVKKLPNGIPTIKTASERR